jgi:hypothetical protein
MDNIFENDEYFEYCRELAQERQADMDDLTATDEQTRKELEYQRWLDLVR